MKPINRLLILFVVFVPALASAQGYYGPGPGSPYPSGFHHRMGRLAWGFSVGLGGMNDNGSTVTSCDNCNYNPATIEFDGHIGGMLSPRFALLFEVQANAQTIHSDAENGDTILTQSVAMVAGQYWLTPIFWIKGGIGLANLQASDGGYFQEDLGNGLGMRERSASS